MPLEDNQRLGSYEIVRALGAGGMGEVYRARDTRLGREVALKILPPDVTNEPGRLERFDREARAIAALNHPHIVTIYSTEEADGIRFLTMELVDGCTLSDLVMSSGMAMPRFLEIAIPLADALAAAHQKQITHRDLKPGNVMVSNDGRVKVLDFGLARVGGADAGEHSLIATQAPITHHGTIVGTMPYMSPEQVEGRLLDARSDLFSLGVIFYELLSGDRPFKGSSSPALMSAILRDTPSSVGDKRPDVPEAIDRLISRLLEKRPEDRIQTARDVFNELRHIQGDGGTVKRKSSDRSTIGNLTVAVQPFESRSGDEHSNSLADGLGEQIANGLSRFGHLRVLSGGSGASPARYSLGGQIRKAGQSIRVSARLIDAHGGATLWAENHDVSVSDDFFALQDRMASRIVATIGDESGVLMRAMAASIADLPLDQLSVSELVVRYFAYAEDFRPDEHAQLRTAFERALEREPRVAEGWACLAMLCEHEHGFGYNPLPNTVQRHRIAAERAIALDARSPHAWAAMVTVHLFAQDLPGVRAAVERVASLNPLNADLIARSALFLDLAGDHDRALALTNDAIALKPQHPASYHFVPFNTFYARGDDERALEEAKLLWMPKLPVAHMSAAAAAGQLGRAAEARVAINALRHASPGLVSVEAARAMWSTWMWNEPFIDRLVDGFGKAIELSLNDGHPSTMTSSKPPSSQVNRSSRGGSLTVAVLPFVPRSSDDDSKALADGLTDDITSGLSRFGYLQVLSRSITERLAREHTHVNSHARYALEGSVRKSGTHVRVGITLVDTQAGTNLWTQNYDRDAGGGLFALQDDVASAAVAVIGDQTGVLVRAMAAAMAERPVDELSVAELVIRYHLYAEAFRPDEHLRLRDAFERALEKEPRAAEGWACLALLYEHEHGFGLNRKPDAPDRHRRAAERAVELDPRSQLAWIALVSVHRFARDREAAKGAVERAVSINPLNADMVALAGLFVSLCGEYDRGHALVVSATARKPQHAGWYHVSMCHYHIAHGDYESALREIKAVNMPMMPLALLGTAAVAGHLGRVDEAKAALASVRQINPALAELEHARAFFGAWYLDDRFIETLAEGFRKALTLTSVQRSSDSGSTDVRRPTDPSIAVLPFTDLSEKKDQDWFCDGIAEELLNALATLPGLRVAARASAFSFRGKTDDLRVIGEKLNVDTVLEGSVRRSGDRVRITTQLSDARQGRQVWSERFDRELKDIFDVQEEIARAIAERLRVTIAGGAGRLVQKTTTNIEAYELMLKGRGFLNRRGPGIVHAIECFEKAIAIDPNMADAHAGLGDTYRLFLIYGVMPAAEAMPLSRASLERALAIEPDQVEALATLANLAHVYDWNYAASAALSDRALAREPSHVRALAESAITLATSMVDDASDALKQRILERIRRARALDPLSAWAMALEAMVLDILNLEPEALESANRAVATDPNNFTAHWARLATLTQMDRVDEARQAAQPGLALSGRHPVLLSELATMLSLHGDAAGAEAIHRELVDRAKTAYIGTASLAVTAAAAGHMADARTFLAQAIAARDSFISFHKLAAFRLLWSDPECAALLRNSAMMQGMPR